MQILPYAPILLSLAGVIISFKAVSLGLKKHGIDIKREAEKAKQDSIEKTASKIFVREEIAKVEVTTGYLNRELRELRDSNIRDHDNIRKDISEKLDMIIKLVS